MNILIRLSVIHLVLALAMVVHAGMFIYDLSHPDLFLHADRASTRFETAQEFWAAIGSADIAKFMASHGVVGDYAFHALVWGIGGAPLVIILQTILTLMAGYGVYRICILLGWHARLAVSACVLFLVFPHSIVFPHQLVTEALHTPLLVLSLWATTIYLAGRDIGRRMIIFLVPAALFAGIAALIRPVTLLWPLLVVLVILLILRRYKAGVVFLLVAYMPILVWGAFIASQTGEFGMGKSSFDMPHNLYQRVKRISQTLPQADAEHIRKTFLTQGEEGVMRTSDYVSFAFHYPLPFFEHSLRDTVIFIVKSGIERLTIDYLDLVGEARQSIQDGQGGWRLRLDREGLGATFYYLWQTQGMVLMISVLGSLVMIAVFILSILGARCLLLGQRLGERWKIGITIIVVLLPLYVLVFSQVVNAMQSRHRAPAESALAMLAIAGAACITRRKNLLSTRVEA